MVKIFYATTNPGKVRSLEKRLSPLGIEVLQTAIEIPEPRSSDVEEIARAKIQIAYKKLKRPVVVLDGGFYIQALGGFPRAFVNFALETVGLEGILKLMEHQIDRNCEFRESMAFMAPQLKEPVVVNAKIAGTLSHAVRGVLNPSHWSKLALIFIPEGRSTTIAELGEKEYLDWYHNKESTSRNFAEWLKRNYI